MTNQPHDRRSDDVTRDFMPSETSAEDQRSSMGEETIDFSPGSSTDAADSDEQFDLELSTPEEKPSDPELSGPALPRFGRYVLLEQLGQGSMGEVYRALHTRLHKQVALKLLPTGKATNRQARDRFEREIQLISRLSHVNVVRLENAGVVEGQPYLIMAYVAGLNLKQLIARTGPLRPADACQLVGQVALGLAHLDQHRLVHRDIKPSNLIFCTVDGSVKIADLGVARLAEGPSEITASGKVVGDPHYMAPEQIEGRQLDIRADIYGLGCTLFTLLTGKPPYNEVAGDIPEILKGHLQRRFPRLAGRCPEASSSLQRVLDQMTARNAEDRLAHPLDVTAALAPFAAGCDLQKLIRSTDPAAAEFDSGSVTGIHSAEYLSIQSATAGENSRRRPTWWPQALLVTAAVAGVCYLLYLFEVVSLDW